MWKSLGCGNTKRDTPENMLVVGAQREDERDAGRGRWQQQNSDYAAAL